MIQAGGRASPRQPPLRTFLVQGQDAPGSLEAATGPDVVVVDASADESGPALAARLIPEMRRHPQCPPLYVRISALSLGRGDAELDTIMPYGPDGIILPGAVGLRDVDHLGAKLAVQEARHDLRDEATAIVAVVGDSARGALWLPAFPSDTPPRLVGIACDLDRLAREIRCAPDAPAVAHVASLTVLAAAASAVPAIYMLSAGGAGDSLTVNFRDIRRQGFSAVILSDPAAVATANGVFGQR